MMAFEISLTYSGVVMITYSSCVLKILAENIGEPLLYWASTTAVGELFAAFA
jgi:hypothetical protein